MIINGTKGKYWAQERSLQYLTVEIHLKVLKSEVI